MREFSLRALVIRENDLGEQDKLLTLLSAKQGRLTARCRGSKSLKSKKLSAASLFCYGDFTLCENKGMLSVKEIHLIESFYAIREDLSRMALANYVAEVLQKVTTEENEESELFSLGLNTLHALCYTDKAHTLIKAVFELRCLFYLGFAPDLACCTLCNTEKSSPFYLDVEEGTLICHDCRMTIETVSALLSLSESTLSAMRYVLSAPSKRIFSFTLNESALGELSLITERFFLAKTETHYKTLKFYHSIL